MIRDNCPVGFFELPFNKYRTFGLNQSDYQNESLKQSKISYSTLGSVNKRNGKGLEGKPKRKKGKKIRENANDAPHCQCLLSTQSFASGQSSATQAVNPPQPLPPPRLTQNQLFHYFIIVGKQDPGKLNLKPPSTKKKKNNHS